MKTMHVSMLLLGATMLVQGCATITRGTTEVLVIETTPSGAEASLSNGLRCTTPCALEVKRKTNVVVDITKPGFESARINVLSEVAGAGAAGMAGNVLLGGVIGAGVDAATGATKRLVPNPVRVTLNPVTAKSTP
ncbi:MAG: PEGA domain-containing protein [Sinobacteraceae bacterium]|nr:PEGA domain-containing protein [Nevskiaceae bacterium]